MDFNKFDTAARAEEGFDYHIKCAATGKPMFDNDEDPYVDNGKPCVVVMKGREAESVRAALREINKARAAAEKSEDKDENGADFDQVHDLLVPSACVLITGFKNVNRDGKPAEAKDAEWFLNLNRFTGPSERQSFVEQITTAANDRGNVLGNGLSA
ncbi:hypothetical protein MHM39_14855 [Phaeobacter sp. CNT1-3]|nr:hypothetical protein [Phaeobacter sp. CNT1-3]